MASIYRNILAATSLLLLLQAGATSADNADNADIGGTVDLRATQVTAPEAITLSTLGASSWGSSIGVSGVERTLIADNIAWYQFNVPVGSGPHDVIRLHRVVRERAPWHPARTRRGAFLAHGDAWGFAATFMTSLAAPGVSDEQNMPVFLAQNGIDVWGIDFRWSLVPVETSDLSFMADWGIATSLDDLDSGLTVARMIRLATGSGISRLSLLGFSRGGTIGWAQLNAETQRPPTFRHVSGYVAVDHVFKTDDEAIRVENCGFYSSIEGSIAGGTIVSENSFAVDVGNLALTDPDSPSPYFAALSNADIAEYLGAITAGGSIPNLHSAGGLIDPLTLETELLYTAPELWFTFLASASAYQPLAINLDGAALVCDELDSPFDDHLAQIRVPIFYVGSVGAFGAPGIYTTSLVGSSDVQHLLVNETANPSEDFGHNDLFLATSAETIVWQPILDWLQVH